MTFKNLHVYDVIFPKFFVHVWIASLLRSVVLHLKIVVPHGAILPSVGWKVLFLGPYILVDDRRACCPHDVVHVVHQLVIFLHATHRTDLF